MYVPGEQGIGVAVPEGQWCPGQQMLPKNNNYTMQMTYKMKSDYWCKAYTTLREYKVKKKEEERAGVEEYRRNK